MRRFYWLVDGVLAGCSCPGDSPGRAGGAVSLESDLRWLRERGIGALLTLTESPLDQGTIVEQGMDVLHIPVVDMTAPYPGQLMESLQYIDRHRANGDAVAVHCLQGQGRTGAVLAAYLVRDGMEPDAAIAHLRDLCPGALSAPEQETAIRAFGERRDWIM
jgi:atypical dual specificity phosphatase